MVEHDERLGNDRQMMKIVTNHENDEKMMQDDELKKNRENDRKITEIM